MQLKIKMSLNAQVIKDVYNVYTPNPIGYNKKTPIQG